MLKNKNTGLISKQTTEIKKLEHMLSQATTSLPRLLSSNGEEIILPESIYEILLNVVRQMSTGQEILITPINKQLTTQEAADFLSVSRPYMVKLLESKELPHCKVGTHRRISLCDLIEYKQQRQSNRRNKLQEMTAFLQEEGYYDYNESDSSCD